MTDEKNKRVQVKSCHSGNVEELTKLVNKVLDELYDEGSNVVNVSVGASASWGGMVVALISYHPS